MESEIVCVGGLMVDVSTFLSRMPHLEEMSIASDCVIGFGGKAGNQAIAISRLGGKVAFVGRLGSDPLGKSYIEHLKKHGVAVRHVGESPDVSSGVAQIFVNDSTGLNLIIGVLGANLQLSEEHIRQAADTIKRAKVVSVSLDVPLASAVEALRLAKESQVSAVLNVAPLDSAKQLASERSTLSKLLGYAEFICLNEVEARAFSQFCTDLGECDCGCSDMHNDVECTSHDEQCNPDSPSVCAFSLADSDSAGLHKDEAWQCHCSISQSVQVTQRLRDARRVMCALQRGALRAGNAHLVPFITMGESGVLVAEPLARADPLANGHLAACAGNRFLRVAAPHVTVLDTCGASDALLAAFVLLRVVAAQHSVHEQLLRAVHFASLTVTRRGTQTSYPSLRELAPRHRALFTRLSDS